MLFFRFVEAADQRRKHVAVGRMVVVVRTVEIRRHYADIIRAVLTVQVFAVFQSGNLRQSVGFIGLFQLGCQQTLFFHGLGGHTRVNARRTQEFQLLAPVLPCRMDHVHLQDHVLVHEVSQGALVRFDAPDFRGGQKDIFRLFFGEETFDGLLMGQIEFLVRAGDDIGISLTLQFAHDG